MASNADLGPYEIPAAHKQYIDSLGFVVDPDRTSLIDGRYKAFRLTDKGGLVHNNILKHFKLAGYVCHDKVYRYRTQRWVTIEVGNDSVQISHDKATHETAITFGHSMEAISIELRARLKKDSK